MKYDVNDKDDEDPDNDDDDVLVDIPVDGVDLNNNGSDNTNTIVVFKLCIALSWLLLSTIGGVTGVGVIGPISITVSSLVRVILLNKDSDVIMVENLITS